MVLGLVPHCTGSENYFRATLRTEGRQGITRKGIGRLRFLPSEAGRQAPDVPCPLEPSCVRRSSPCPRHAALLAPSLLGVHPARLSVRIPGAPPLRRRAVVRYGSRVRHGDSEPAAERGPPRGATRGGASRPQPGCRSGDRRGVGLQPRLSHLQPGAGVRYERLEVTRAALEKKDWWGALDRQAPAARHRHPRRDVGGAGRAWLAQEAMPRRDVV